LPAVLNQLFAMALEAASAVIAPRRAFAAVTEFERVIPDLGSALDGYTIVVLADLHHRHPFDDVAWLRHAVTLANAANPDVVALLGDYASSFKQAAATSRRWYAEALPAMSSELRRLRPKDGVVAVLGNHDYYAGADLVREWLGSIGARLLVNTAACVVRSDSVLRIAGLDDSSEGEVDPLAGCGLENQMPTLLLSHQPDGIRRLDPRLRVDALLAGHTHGGQIVLPWLGAPVTMSRTCGRRSAHGWVSNPRAPLLVTRGLGEQLPLPIRVGSPPEIVVLRLRTPHQQPA
jgi:predicted MPP superfamily phosphohydrolase